MDAPFNQVFTPGNLQELFSAWSRFPDAVPFAGGTDIIRSQGGQALALPRNILSLDMLEELRRITRTERYLEIGAMVKISDIIYLGKVVPEILTRCLMEIAGPQLRNLASIGGNICCPGRRLDASAPLIALDAHYELRNASSFRWISAARFASLPGPLAINPQELLTRIRIPLERWDYSLHKKFTLPGKQGEAGGLIVLIARIQKSILTDLRIVYAGDRVLRDKNTDTLLIGKQLPLDRKDALNFTEHWKTYLSALDAPDALVQAKMLNFIQAGVLGLAD
ncbi:MAG: FAD binding domain-containing protein [Treponema sp.]|jgi:CO/xanthine dehydrogenase FAD-binding subunit|nr:FAD binding domain-containing protein [Treponema sp.]